MLSDPIAALATPAGRSALAVIRLSGAGAFEVAARVGRVHLDDDLSYLGIAAQAGNANVTTG